MMKLLVPSVLLAVAACLPQPPPPQPMVIPQPQLVTVATVPASEMPPVAGHGWYCYDARTTTYEYDPSTAMSRGESRDARPCFRTREKCRDSASSSAVVGGGATTVSPCASRKEAACTYLWFSDGSGRHTCSAEIDDCRATMVTVSNTAPGIASPTHQSDCVAVR